MHTVGKKLLVKLVKEEKKIGSIVMPETVNTPTVLAVVEACGGRVRGVEEGEVVRFSRHTGTQVEGDLYVIEEGDVLVVL